MFSVPMTVVETPGFIRDASAALTDKDRSKPGGGRHHGRDRRRPKVALEGTGTRQTGRCAGDLLFHNESLPLFLLNVFAKNEQANLTRAERNAMKALLPRLVAGYRKRMTL